MDELTKIIAPLLITGGLVSCAGIAEKIAYNQAVQQQVLERAFKMNLDVALEGMFKTGGRASKQDLDNALVVAVKKGDQSKPIGRLYSRLSGTTTKFYVRVVPAHVAAKQGNYRLDSDADECAVVVTDRPSGPLGIIGCSTKAQHG